MTTFISPIARDWQVCQMVKALTNAVEHLGHGLWLAEPEVTFQRARLYHQAELDFNWDYAQDAEAAGRLKLWHGLFRGAQSDNSEEEFKP